MGFDYENHYLTGKTVKVEKFNNMPFQISNYTIFREIFRDDTGDGKIEHHMIEMEDIDGQIGLIEITIPEVWTSIKDHLKIGTEVKASGIYHYDENNNLIYIQVESIKYNDICISKKEISSNEGKTSSGRNILEDKKMLIMLIVWVILLLMLKISIVVFGILFLIDTIVLAVYAVIGNKKMGVNVDSLLEKSGLERIEQYYTEVIRKI